ncbi:MAG: hypothetical protein INH41_13545 [Myxococcaceae bacterium]|nr:hypothetical protein [Myxococcaceae bacterium]
MGDGPLTSSIAPTVPVAAAPKRRLWTWVLGGGAMVSLGFTTGCSVTAQSRASAGPSANIGMAPSTAQAARNLQLAACGLFVTSAVTALAPVALFFLEGA